MTTYPKLQDRDLTDRLLEAISKGAKRNLACKYAGVSQVQFSKWIDRARAIIDSGEPYSPDEPHVSFYNRLRKAEADRCLPLIDYIKRAAVDDWRAADRLLSRYEPKEYGDKDGGIEKKLDDTASEIAQVRELVARCIIVPGAGGGRDGQEEEPNAAIGHAE